MLDHWGVRFGMAQPKPVTANTARLGVETLSAVDTDITALLRADPYSTNRDIGARLRLHETEVARRIRTMDESHSMRLMAVLDIFKAGYSMLAHARITAQPKREREVVRALIGPKLRRNLCSLHTTDSPCLLEATFRIATHADLADLIRDGLAQVPSILTAEIDTTVAIERYRLGVSRLTGLPPGLAGLDAFDDLKRSIHTPQLDDLDLQIVTALQQAGRTSSREMARRFDVTDGTIRNRLGKLDRLGLMRIFPILDVRLAGVSDVTRIRASIRPAELRRAISLLLGDSAVAYISETTGSRNLHFMLTTPDAKATRATLTKLSKAAGMSDLVVTKVGTVEFLDHRWQVLSA